LSTLRGLETLIDSIELVSTSTSFPFSTSFCSLGTGRGLEGRGLDTFASSFCSLGTGRGLDSRDEGSYSFSSFSSLGTGRGLEGRGLDSLDSFSTSFCSLGTGRGLEGRGLDTFTTSVSFSSLGTGRGLDSRDKTLIGSVDSFLSFILCSFMKFPIESSICRGHLGDVSRTPFVPLDVSRTPFVPLDVSRTPFVPLDVSRLKGTASTFVTSTVFPSEWTGLAPCRNFVPFMVSFGLISLSSIRTPLRVALVSDFNSFSRSGCCRRGARSEPSLGDRGLVRIPSLIFIDEDNFFNCSDRSIKICTVWRRGRRLVVTARGIRRNKR